jgi:hypothetical protein
VKIEVKNVKRIRCDNVGDYVPSGTESDLPSEDEGDEIYQGQSDTEERQNFTANKRKQTTNNKTEVYLHKHQK